MFNFNLKGAVRSVKSEAKPHLPKKIIISFKGCQQKYINVHVKVVR
jgi:hypothetical protein